MSTTLLPPDDDQRTDDSHNLKPKKDKVIQPINDIPPSRPAIAANEELLAELRARTAELAEQVRGQDEPAKHVLHLEDEPVTEQEVIAALKSEDSATSQDASSANPAIELVRQKLDRLYKKEPDAADEAVESYQAGTHRSKHQQFMYDLTTSGKSLAEIQTEWHRYYVALPNDEKHKVWQEFYETQAHGSQYFAPIKAERAIKKYPKPKHAQLSQVPRIKHMTPSHTEKDVRTVGEVKTQLLDKINAGGKLTPMQHAKSLLFGLGLAAIVGLILTFTFFNEAFIAPFISPGRNVSATPIIGSVSGKVGPEPKIIIPKINLEVPVVFDMDTIEEQAIQNALEDGVVHYASTPNPGEVGNAVIVGHSSNNILNSGKYKFAFVLLKRLESEDIFYVQKGGVRYTYKVYRKEIVSPSDTTVLDTQEKKNTITLITCDPPGTSINRLIIVAEQISPDPKGNKASSALELDTSSVNELPSNAPTLWSRLWPF